MKVPDARLSRPRRLAWACAVLVLAITSLSAFIRLSRAGLGCEPWPHCQAQRAALGGEALAASDPPAVVGARVAHRVAASAALLLLVGLLFLAFARQPVLRTQGRLVLALLVVAVLLAGLGRVAGASRAPPVVLGNLLGGFAMVALAARLVQAGGAGPRGVASLRAWTLAVLALVFVQAGLGGLVAAAPTAASCQGSGLCMVHRVGGMLVVAAVLALAIGAWRRRAHAMGATLAVLVLVQAGLGIWQLAGAVPLALGLAHNAGAALLAAGVGLLLPGRGSG
ncbi:COX15/CtaA family protein [Ramlibacter sp. USB13]|uniref:COX15/CtaA family protein n=1 Tax=Ramlibacter cellulosilyticus TaxID=2764187 RepID=A0A923MXR8_9BURK|nr:COX15/CtaA family protein [Ramlibacter cellulosilyticus]MBC5785647.1 COX15/CtaA family protein [Ramlibacter cellulosilyticus]